MSDSGYTPSTITDYVLTVLNDQKYGHDIEWVRLNLRRSHLEQKEAAHDAVIREDQAERDIAIVNQLYPLGSEVLGNAPMVIAVALRSQSFTGTESEQNG